jgi:hypothetical protein
LGVPTEKLGDVGMIPRSEHFRFALKSGEPLRIVRERFGQNFDGHIAPELRVVRLVDFAHSAGTNGGGDFIRSEFGAGVQQQIPRCARDFGWQLIRRQNASTSPIPPAPMAAVISYDPSLAPVLSIRSFADK